MITITERRRGDPVDLLTQAVTPGLLAMAEVGAAALRMNLSAGARSGEKYAGLPRQSSAPGEYSQFQKGTLFLMVDAELVSPVEAVFGLFPETVEEAEEATAQEFGAPRNHLAARANVRNTGLDPRVHAAMEAALRSALS